MPAFALVALLGGHTISTTAVTIATTAMAITITGQLFQVTGRACDAYMVPVGRGGRTICEGSSVRTAIGTARCAVAGCTRTASACEGTACATGATKAGPAYPPAVTAPT